MIPAPVIHGVLENKGPLGHDQSIAEVDGVTEREDIRIDSAGESRQGSRLGRRWWRNERRGTKGGSG